MQPFRSAFLTVAVLLSAVAAARGSADEVGTGQQFADLLADLPLGRRLEETDLVERSMLSDAGDGRLDDHTLLQSALIADGLRQSRRLEQYRGEFGHWAERLNNELSAHPTLDAPELAQNVLEFLHREILVGSYRADCSQVSVALDRGDFNCVSATLLFNCLALAAGLEPVAVELPGHVFSRVKDGAAVIDIETTCLAWFEHADEAARTRQLHQRGIPSSQPAVGSHLAGRRKTPVQLLAIVYYNDGVQRLSQRQYADAIAAFQHAAALDPDSRSIRGNLLATVNNWALDLSGRGRFEDAIALLTSGRTVAPEHRSFHINYVAVHQAWLESLYAAKDYDAALAAIEKAVEEMPDEPFFPAARLDVYRRRGRRLALDGQLDEAVAWFVRLQAHHHNQEESRWTETAALNDAALELLRQHEYARAIAVLEIALHRQPHSELLAENYRAAVMHWADEAFSRRDYREAVRRTQIALADSPQDVALRGNIRYGYHQWLRQLEVAGQFAAARRVLLAARRSDPRSTVWSDWSTKLSNR